MNIFCYGHTSPWAAWSNDPNTGLNNQHIVVKGAALIRLDQFLKWSQLVSSGGEGKCLIQGGSVLVNGSTERRRGRKLHAGDTVQVGHTSVVVPDLKAPQEAAAPG